MIAKREINNLAIWKSVHGEQHFKQISDNAVIVPPPPKKKKKKKINK